MTLDPRSPSGVPDEAPGPSIPVEIWISTLLRVGVGLSLLLIVTGTVLSFLHHPGYATSADELVRLTRPGAAFPRTPGEIAEGLLHLRGQAIVSAGLFLLILTPVMRVAVSLMVFLSRRDRVYVLVTLGVLLLLLASILVGHGE